MKRVVFLILVLLGHMLSAQQNRSSRNGSTIPVNDTLRVFYVFAEMLYENNEDSNWLSGQMPNNPDEYFDADLDPNNINGFMTKYFYQASFGQYIVLGDYYLNLIQVDTSINDPEGMVLNYLDTVGGNDILTARGKSINNGDFDFWTEKTGQGIMSVKNADNRADMVMIVWRSNPSHLLEEGSGFVRSGGNNPIKNLTGIDRLGQFASLKSNPWQIMRHEYAHPMFGDNSFHNAGGGTNADRTFIADRQSWSMLSSADASLKGWSAWDLHRLGWKHASNQFHISARNESDYTEVNSDLIYGQGLSNNGTSSTEDEFILRDFVTYGDAIRIELPFVQSELSSMKKQYLWLENHQGLSVNIDLGPKSTTGIYAYIQVGKDDTAQFEGLAGYTTALSKVGSYDYTPSNDSTKSWSTINATVGEDDNPFCGYSHLQWHAIDTEKDGDIKRREYIHPAHINLVNGYAFNPTNDYNYEQAAWYGTSQDAFVPNAKINLSTNPAPVPILTYKTKSSENDIPNLLFQNNFQFNDTVSFNRQIYLNNIGIDIIEERPNPNGHGKDMVVRIKWNENFITEDVRWCGSMVASNGVFLSFFNQETKIDRSLTPTIPYAEPDGIFSLPSDLRLKAGSTTSIRDGSNFYVRDNSSLTIEENATFFMQHQYAG